VVSAPGGMASREADYRLWRDRGIDCFGNAVGGRQDLGMGIGSRCIDPILMAVGRHDRACKVCVPVAITAALMAAWWFLAGDPPPIVVAARWAWGLL